MSDSSEISEGSAKRRTQRIKAVTQKIALAEERLEEAISQEIDSVEKGAKKVDQAVASFREKHPGAYGLLLTIVVCIGLVIIALLCAQYYSNK